MNRDNDTNATNKFYDTDIKHTFRYTRWLLEILGLWSTLTRNSEIKTRYVSRLVVTICLLTIAFTMLPSTLHTIYREKNPVVRLKLVGPVSASVVSFVKYVLMITRTNAIKVCVENIEKDWTIYDNDKDRAIMTRNATIGRSITLISGLFLYTAGMFFLAILPIFKGSRINEFNETIRPIVYPGYDIFVEPQISPNYEIIFFLTCVSGFVRYTVSIAVCNIAAVCVTHACGQIEIVMSRLNSIFDGIRDDETSIVIIEERISFIVRCHARGLRLSTKIDEALRDIFLIEVMAATLVICWLEYYCMMEWNNSDAMGIITYLLLLMSYVFNIFILCHIGELLKDKCEKIGKAAYMIEWYRFPGKNGLAIVMILAMSNYPRKITAGRMMELSVCSFGIIIKTSVVYLNMLRAATD